MHKKIIPSFAQFNKNFVVHSLVYNWLSSYNFINMQFSHESNLISRCWSGPVNEMGGSSHKILLWRHIRSLLLIIWVTCTVVWRSLASTRMIFCGISSVIKQWEYFLQLWNYMLCCWLYIFRIHWEHCQLGILWILYSDYSLCEINCDLVGRFCF